MTIDYRAVMITQLKLKAPNTYNLLLEPGELPAFLERKLQIVISSAEEARLEAIKELENGQRGQPLYREEFLRVFKEACAEFESLDDELAGFMEVGNE